MANPSHTRTWAPYRAYIQQIVRWHPTLKEAAPTLRLLAIDLKIGSIELIDGYLALAPEQRIECKVCHADVPLFESAKGKCFDCMALEYDDALFRITTDGPRV